MKKLLIAKLIELLLGLLTPELLKKVTDQILDAIEDATINSENTMDDKVVLPLCKLIRNTFDISDDD